MGPSFEHTVHKSDDNRKFWLTCDGVQFARLLLDDPTLSAPEFGVVASFTRTATKAHMEIEHPDPRCTVDVGSRPSWMSPDQYDPCRCTLPRGHEGAHACEHTIAKEAKARG
jgi:hypothetical protein